MLYPDRCLFCGEVVEPGVLCCRHCLHNLPELEGGRVKFAGSDPFKWVASPMWYKEGARHAVVEMKFHGHKEAADCFVPYMVEALKKCGGADYKPDWVVPVPMGAERLAERGYNQAALLAEGIAKRLDTTFFSGALVRSGTLVQHDLSARLRRLEAQKSFQLAEQVDPSGKTILLVDDVYTTCSTLRRCAWLLIDAGAAEVAGVTATVTPMKKQSFDDVL